MQQLPQAVQRKGGSDVKMTWPWREVAKFASGFEAFHSIAHCYLYAASINLSILGFTQTPTWNLVSTVLHGAIAVLLGRYAWRSRR